MERVRVFVRERQKMQNVYMPVDLFKKINETIYTY
jgi:hypothetical protein